MNKKILCFLALFGSTFGAQAQSTLSQRDENISLDKGKHLFERQKYASARFQFQSFLDNEKNASQLEIDEAEYFIAVCALYLENADGGNLIEAYAKKHEGSGYASLAYFDLGGYYFKRKKYDEAVDHLEKVDQYALNESQKNDYLFWLSYSYFLEQRFDDALPMFNRLKLSDNKYKYAAYYYSGYIHYKQEKYDRALRDLKAAGKTDIYSAQVPYFISNIYYKQKDYRQLVEYAEPFAKNKRSKVVNNDEIKLLVAESYFEMGDYENASRYFEEYTKVKKSPKADVLYRAALANMKLDRLDKAEDNFKKVALVEDSLGYYASYYLGGIYVKDDRKPFALSAYDKAQKTSFNDEMKEEAAYNHSRLCMELEKYEDAVVSMRKFKEEFPESQYVEELDQLIGEAYLRSNDFKAAVEHLESLSYKSSKMKKDFQQVTFSRGVQLFNQGKLKSSVGFFKKSLKYPINHELVIQAHYWMGEAYSIAKRYADAKDHYLQIQTLASDTHEFKNLSYYGLGYAYFNEEKYNLALPYFKRYVESNASNKHSADALMRLADCYYVQKAYVYAIDNYKKSVQEKNPDTDYAYFQLGMISGIEKDLSSSRAYFDKVLEVEPKSRYYDDALYQLAVFESVAGNSQASLKLLDQLIEDAPESLLMPFAYERKAISYSNLGNYSKAVEEYKVVIDEYPTSSNANSALLGLQEALSKAGKQNELDAYIAKYKEANPDSETVENVAYESAKSLYFDQQYHQASKSLSNYLIDYPNSPYLVDAKYYLADSYYRLRDDENAVKWFNDVIEDSKNRYLPKALSKVSEIHFTQKEYEKAVQASKHYSGIARSKKDQFKAWSMMVKSYYELEKYDSVDYYAHEIIDKVAVSANATNMANLYIGKAALGKGLEDEAMDQFIITMNTAKDANGAEAQYLLAEVFHKRGQYEQSIQTLYDLSKNFGVYEYWLSKAFLLIADNYIESDELFQAKATLQSIIDKSPVEEVVNGAKERMKKISVLEEETISSQDSSGMEMVDVDSLHSIVE
ncbi:tetratricopeptide repeat protein [Aureibacter tunicatorum]|uniref:Tetratricopeptide (TPR) repeat protein n=1 Tax=Aureibacter tunicatorum TaxID=866807 RepID=A0AAE3XQL6_9BACT|nr:tetratricopeptide repeat protein [Aureibacter tunicatorum]MDR6239599.1 tetratricopeptide (TPR) repeat protein [Aureibacter tunicatorum]BDD04076.1 hypothetical protein AUTU_15590 [Aureibacter tunicatorum]